MLETKTELDKLEEYLINHRITYDRIDEDAAHDETGRICSITPGIRSAYRVCRKTVSVDGMQYVSRDLMDTNKDCWRSTESW